MLLEKTAAQASQGPQHATTEQPKLLSMTLAFGQLIILLAWVSRWHRQQRV